MKPTVDIFIRTYPKDYPWLAYALKSIHQNVTGWRNIIVASPDCSGLRHLTAERLVEVQDLPDGYLGQQLTKMEAWKYTDAEYILYWDSDLIAVEKFDICDRLFFLQETTHWDDEKIAAVSTVFKPVLIATPYADLSGPVLKWKPITEKAIGQEVFYEFMRRLPVLHPAAVVEGAYNRLEDLHGMTFRQYLEAQPYREFSEFNYIGAYAFHTPCCCNYEWVNTATQEVPPNPCRQFWSWGGIDKPLPEEGGKTPRQIIEEALK
jgi:hypothetical protein